MPSARDLVAELDALLEPARFRDYGPNGLQVEGIEATGGLTTLATAATASLAACRAANAAGAECLLVHHGLFWGGGEVRVVGPLALRLRELLANGIALIAYHLPLDAHPEVGNNAVALGLLGARDEGAFGEKDLGRRGALPEPTPIARLMELCRQAFGHPVLHCPGGPELVRSVGVVSGGGHAWLPAAKAAGCDAFITGEIAEQTWHEAAELGIHCLACGHAATEDLAVHRLGERLAQRHGLRHVRIASDNPV